MKLPNGVLVPGCVLAAASPAALASSSEETLSMVTLLLFYGSIAFAIAVFAGVYFLRPQDRRETPLRALYTDGGAVHAVAPDTLVSECVQMMRDRKIGALLVRDAAGLRGIFTERDALNRVLAAGRDPKSVRVAEVMTPDPVSVTPATTVDAAMALVTRQRFRHLPVVDESGRLLALVSSGDLTRWLVSERIGEVRDLVTLAAGD